MSLCTSYFNSQLYSCPLITYGLLVKILMKPLLHPTCNGDKVAPIPMVQVLEVVMLDIKAFFSVLNILPGPVQVETYGSMEKREKVEFILEQMRLCLAKKDYIRTQIISKKISPKYFENSQDQVSFQKWLALQMYL